MLKICIVLFSVCSFNTFASTKILEKHHQSGYLRPEDSFLKDCTIMSNQVANITLRTGENLPVSYSRRVPLKKLLLLKSLIRAARKGKIEITEILCDAGESYLYGYTQRKKVLIDERPDCGEHRVNRSRATAPILKLSEQICQF